MSLKRRISFESKTNVYHKPGCRYLKRILPQNYYEISKHEAITHGYRSCRCCNSMDNHYRWEEHTLKHYHENKDMEFKYEDGILYAKTEMGFWKLVYSRHLEKIAIYHRNASDNPVDMNNLKDERFHRQKDIQYAETIEALLSYIYEHDKYKKAVSLGQKNIQYSSKKYERSAAKRERRQNINRVNYLFRMLESEHKDYKELSYC